MNGLLTTTLVCWALCSSATGSKVVAAPGSCEFPFIYRGVTYNKCTTVGWGKDEAKRPWCSLTRNYDTDPRWKLCEGEVKVQNVALRGRPTMSSILAAPFKENGYIGHAMNAVDGNHNSDVFLGSCAHTNNDMSPWWRVDLLEPHVIQYVTITNAIMAPERMNGAEILIGNSLSNNGNDNPRCAIITYIPSAGSKTFQCNEMVGQFVNIFIRGRKEYLTPCEVEVFGYPEDQSCSCDPHMG